MHKPTEIFNIMERGTFYAEHMEVCPLNDRTNIFYVLGAVICTTYKSKIKNAKFKKQIDSKRQVKKLIGGSSYAICILIWGPNHDQGAGKVNICAILS